MKFIKKIFCFILLIAINKVSYTQVASVPQGILFQAVARDANNNAASNRNIYVQIAIKRATTNGTTDYAESFKVVSSQEGIFSIVIGQGTRISGVSSLTSLEWTKYTYFVNLKIAIEPTLPDPSWTAANNYVDIGTSQLWTVPYSFTSNNAIFSDSASTITGILTSNKGGTGVNNNGKTITIANNIITKGIGDLTINTTAASNVIFPISGILANTQYVSDRIAADTISLSDRIDKLGVNSSANINLKLNIADTNTMLNSRIGKDTISLSNRINLKADKLNAKIDSSLYVKGKTTITDSLLVRNSVKIDSNLYIGGKLIVASGFNFIDSLTVARGARIDSSLLLKGKLLLKDSLVASGNARIDLNLNVNGRTRLSDSLSVRGVTRLNDSLTVRGVTRLSDSLTVKGITRLNDSLLVRNSVKIDSNLYIGGKLTVASGFDFKDSLTVARGARIDSSLLLKGKLLLKDSLVASGNARIDLNLNVNGRTRLSDSLSVRGVTRLNDSLIVKNISILSKIQNDSTTITSKLRSDSTIINRSLVDSANYLNARINTKVNISDSATMLANYARKFTQDFKVKIAPGKYLGKYMSGDSVRSKGMTLDQFLNDIITEVVHPVYVPPTVTLTSPTSVDYEIGSSITGINLTKNFVQNDAGAIVTTTYKKNGVSLAGASDNISIMTTDQSYSVQIDYAAGAIKLNNLEQSDSVGRIAAGSITSAGITLSVKSKRFWGTSSSTNPIDSEIQNAANEFATSKEKSGFSIPITSGTKYLFYAYPAGYTNLSSLSVGGFESLPAFTPITRTFVNTKGYSSTYIIYVSNNNFSSSVDNINCK